MWTFSAINILICHFSFHNLSGLLVVVNQQRFPAISEPPHSLTKALQCVSAHCLSVWPLIFRLPLSKRDHFPAAFSKCNSKNYLHFLTKKNNWLTNIMELIFPWGIDGEWNCIKSREYWTFWPEHNSQSMLMLVHNCWI